MKYWLLLFATVLQAQVVKIDCGSPADVYFTSPTAYPTTAWSSPTLGADKTLRFGKKFTYTIPVLPGLYKVSVALQEPNATQANQRVMTVTLNGQITDQIDLWKEFGLLVPHVIDSPLVVSAYGIYKNIIQLDFTGITGNAIVSSISIQPYTQGILSQLPITFGRECQADGEQRFLLDDQNYLMLCVRTPTGNTWLRGPKFQP